MQFITLGVLLAVLTLSNFVTAEVGVSDSISFNAHRQLPEDRELTSCDCTHFYCDSLSYKYHGYSDYHNKCYSTCCVGKCFLFYRSRSFPFLYILTLRYLFWIEKLKFVSAEIEHASKSKSSKGNGGKSKSSSKTSSKSSSKSKPKPKPKPKPHPHTHVYNDEGSYPYYTPAPTPLETILVPERCRCKLDFSDQMCAWCINGSDKCIDFACIDKCCIIKECKCDKYTSEICKLCDKGSSECPDVDCAAACCVYEGEGESAVPKDTGNSTVSEVPPPDNSTEVLQPSTQEQAPTMSTVSTYSISSTVQSMPASFTYSFFAVLFGAALAGIVLSLRVSFYFNPKIWFWNGVIDGIYSSIPPPFLISITYKLNRAQITMAIDQFP